MQQYISVQISEFLLVSEFPALIEGHWLTGIGSLYFECFPLSCILQFGIITGSIIIGIAYLPIIKSLKFDRTNVYSSILVIVCIGYGINSIFEGLAPIGPGVKCYYIGDVRDLQSVRAAMPGVDYIFHAAALKQVPSCEFFPMEAVRTNVIGTENVLTAAIEAGVESVICLSTDKAALVSYPVLLF